MSALVLDTSVIMRWMPASAVPPLAERVRNLLMVEGWGAIVPPLWHWELANAVVIGVRRQGIPLPLAEAWREAGRWSLLVETEPWSEVALEDTVHLADRYRLTAYDAAYLELALRRRLPLATLDRRLQEAARSAGVRVDL
ncbi:MAG TPA: type II toxin-antitoxin system VapC family toxin [Terriglobales bacterium]|nr:type II toxin-antitoxin system VapC family toxin [Terriglobales bacterium]